MQWAYMFEGCHQFPALLHIFFFTTSDPPCGCNLPCTDRELADAAIWQLTHLNPVCHDFVDTVEDADNYYYKNKTKLNFVYFLLAIMLSSCLVNFLHHFVGLFKALLAEIWQSCMSWDRIVVVCHCVHAVRNTRNHQESQKKKGGFWLISV